MEITASAGYHTFSLTDELELPSTVWLAFIEDIKRMIPSGARSYRNASAPQISSPISSMAFHTNHRRQTCLWKHQFNSRKDKGMDNSQHPINDVRMSAPETADPITTTRRQFSNMTPDERREFIYTYQPPREDQIPKFIAVQKAIFEAAKVVEENCPLCADRSHALRLLRDVRMWANAAIALDGVV